MVLKIPDEGAITNCDLSYNKLIEHIDDGIIHIPEFQREFVWTEDEILDLLDSIYKSYPIGSLIFWVTNEDFAYSAPIGDNEINDSIYKHRFFVIDGQQRLKSLYHAAKKKELEMKSGTKHIDVAFDLENEKFILKEDIHDRKKSMYYIPSVNDNDMFFRFLDAVPQSKLSEIQDELSISDGPIDSFLNSLEDLELIAKKDDEYILTRKGRTILEKQDHEHVARILHDKTKFVKDTLQIIKDNPGISRPEAKPEFQNIYGGSLSTAYREFGRRCRWLRALKLIEKRDGEYYITDSGEDVLEDVKQKEKELKNRFVPLDRILVEQEEAIIRVVNDTKDSDTIGAIVGSAVGALHGKEKIPERWISNLSGRTRKDDDGRVFELLEEAKQFWWEN